MYFCVLYFLFVHVCCFYENSESYDKRYFEYLTVQNQLYDDVFDKYNENLSPILTRGVSNDISVFQNASDLQKWNYTIYVYYLKLVDVDEPSEKVSFVLELMEMWYDARLRWNVTKYQNIKTMYIRQSAVWSPTLSAFGVNSIQDFRDQDFRQVSVNYIGAVYTYIPLEISVNCPLKMRMFPFDEQTCLIRFCLPMYYSREIDVLIQFYDAILKPQQVAGMGNSEWEVKNLSGRIDVVRYGEDISDIELCVIEIKMRRNPMYYFYMIILPSYVINTVSIFGVFLKGADKMSKLNVGITTLMTMTFILGVMADNIPKTGEIPLLGIYIIINLSIMIFSIGFMAFIGKIRKVVMKKLVDSKSKYSSQVQNWIGQPLETCVVSILHLVNTINFFIMIIFWIST